MPRYGFGVPWPLIATGYSRSMGSWGAGTFDNDSALDWQGEFLAGTPRPVKLKACFNRVLKSQEGDVDLESAALAAAEVLAGLRGHPAESLPDELADWISASRGKLQDEWRDLAQQAIERIATQSELCTLWRESGQLEEWQQELDRLASRLAQPVQPKAKRPKGPKLWFLKKSGGVSGFTYVARSPRLPDLDAPEWQVQAVRIDIRSPFSQHDYQVLGQWLAQFPAVRIIFEDGQFGAALELDDDTWESVEAGLLAFSSAQCLRLEISPMRNLNFLRQFKQLKDLELHLSGPCDLSALPALHSLEHLAVNTSAGDMFDPESVASAPRLDLAALRGIKASHVRLDYCRLQNAPAALDALQQCNTLILDFFFEAGTFEMPSLAAFTALKRLQFLVRTPQCLQNALDAPNLTELVLYTDSESLDPSMERIANKAGLTHLAIMLQPDPTSGFDEADDIVSELGKELAQPETWQSNT